VKPSFSKEFLNYYFYVCFYKVPGQLPNSYQPEVTGCTIIIPLASRIFLLAALRIVRIQKFSLLMVFYIRCILVVLYGLKVVISKEA